MLGQTEAEGIVKVTYSDSTVRALAALLVDYDSASVAGPVKGSQMPHTRETKTCESTEGSLLRSAGTNKSSGSDLLGLNCESITAFVTIPRVRSVLRKGGGRILDVVAHVSILQTAGGWAITCQ